MKFNTAPILREYIACAPLPLAIERSIECRLYKGRAFERPILDVGCGEGLFAKILFAEPVDTGIDPDARELQYALELGAYSELIQCAGDAIPKPPGYFRTIFSNSVVEHIPELEPVLREVRRVLSEDGVFYFTAPSDMFERYSVLYQLCRRLGMKRLGDQYRAFFNRFWRHYHCYSLAQWTSMVERCGFRVLEAFTYNPAMVCLMNDALVPFSFPSFVAKRLTNRWFFFPTIRRAIAKLLAVILEGRLGGAERSQNGGLVFFALARADEA